MARQSRALTDEFEPKWFEFKLILWLLLLLLLLLVATANSCFNVLDGLAW